MERQKLEKQIYVLEKALSKTPEFLPDGKRNGKYYPLKTKVDQLKKKLEIIKYNEFLGQ